MEHKPMGAILRAVKDQGSELLEKMVNNSGLNINGDMMGQTLDSGMDIRPVLIPSIDQNKRIESKKNKCRDEGVEKVQDSNDLVLGKMGNCLETKETTHCVISDLGRRKIEEEEAQKVTGKLVSTKKENQSKLETPANRSYHPQ
ncbi:hypothetical protein Q3G72_029623 [Acer saccharum]|nr:hypothetical protein Q3G72_029623 [Acer saccharum]